MKCYPGYRVGKPRIREAMDEHNGGRSTGYFGTGVYFYTSKNGVEEDSSFADKRQPLVEMKCACKHPLLLNDDDAKDLHHDSSKWVYSIRHPEYYLLCPTALSEALGINGYECAQRAKKAVEATRKCLAKAGTPYAPQCSQPINHLLSEAGYDCVYPTGEMGDDNRFGAVVFKEAIDECIGGDFEGGNPYGTVVWGSKEAEDEYNREMKQLEEGFERCFIRGER